MLRRIFNRMRNVNPGLFTDPFVDVKVFYVGHNGRMPSVTFIGELDITASFAFLRQHLEREIITILQHSFYDHTEQKMFFTNSIFVLSDNRMIEVAGNYCQVLHTANQHNWADALVKELAQFRAHTKPDDAPATIIGFARQTTLN